MDFADSMMKQERDGARESLMSAYGASSPSVIAGSGGETGKRARVSGWGLEEGSNLKKVKPEFFLPHGFLDPLPKHPVYAPMPLSMRQPSAAPPVVPFSTQHPEAPYLVSPLSMRNLVAPLPVAPLSMRHPAAQPPVVPLSVQHTAAPHPSRQHPAAPQPSVQHLPAPQPSMQQPPAPQNSVQQPATPLPSVQQLAEPPLSVHHPTAPLSVVPLAAHSPTQPTSSSSEPETYSCRQFWKAGDYEGLANSPCFSGEIDHVRVHPKFLHSNATSHKWALGALAELLDNSFDEACNGATFVSINVLENPIDGTKMLLIEDDGGGMDPDKMRQCMSFGYSMKSKSANTIGRYGNGFKTSTMRLGADVIVFSRYKGKDGMSPTQSIGMLSYTFLRNTGKQDIIVPMVDYEKRCDLWSKMERSSSVAWNTNMDSLIQWSPYSSEALLLQQFNSMSDQGTRIIIYNLWEDEEGQLELDFVADVHDIQIRGVNRDEKRIEMANMFPNSRHFLTYQHSLRSYASILYLRLPRGFRMILRGKEIEHHNIVNDMMMKQEITYRPQSCPDGVPRDPNICAVVTIGFVKDATNHIDVQGFNVYHKNRLIKPFWRVWNAAGSDGRGVLGVLEANFVEPAHDKQGFERTTVLNRLEARLLHIQKTYWSSNCQEIGYAPRRQKKSICNSDKEFSPKTPLLAQTTTAMTKAPDFFQPQSSQTPHQQQQATTAKPKAPDFVQLQGSNKNLPSCKLSALSNHDATGSCISLKSDELRGHSSVNSSKIPQKNGCEMSGELRSSEGSRGHFSIPSSDHHGSGNQSRPSRRTRDACLEAANRSLISPPVDHGVCQNHASGENEMKNMSFFGSQSKETSSDCNANGLESQDSGQHTKLLTEEIKALSKLLHELQIERERNKQLTEKVNLLEKWLADSDKQQEILIDLFSQERERRDAEEKKLRNKLKDANDTIKKLEMLATSGSIKP